MENEIDVDILEARIERLEIELQDAIREKEEAIVGRGVLERMVDKLAELGVIDNTPYCKRLYIDGEREL